MSMESLGLPRKRTRSAFLDEWSKLAFQADDCSPDVLAKLGDKAVDVIASKDSLKLAWDHLSKFGGAAPGPNGKSFRDFTRVGSWAEIDRLHAELRLDAELESDRYRHGPVLEMRVPKRPGSTGTRPLALPDVQDRVVGRAEVQVLEPMFRFRLDKRSFCRFSMGLWHALAHLRQIASAEDRWIWISEDISGAFDNVPLARLFDVFYSYIPSMRLLDLIRRSVDDRRPIRLWQGAPLSPLLMNVYLDAMVDRPWRQLHPDVPLLRYMDDLLILCNIKDDAAALYRDLFSLVETAGLELKHRYDTARHEVHTQSVQWLGYRLRKGTEGLEILLPFDGEDETAKKWRRYPRERFVALHNETDSPFAATQLINGFFAWAGPTLPWTDTRAAYELLRKAARSAAFEEIIGYQSALRQWQQHHERWDRKCTQIIEAENRKPFELPVYEGRDWAPDQAPWEVPSIVIAAS